MDAEGLENVHTDSMKWIDDCFARGLQIYGQAVTVRAPFQFTLEHWNLYDSSPAWNHATQGTIEERTAKMSDPKIRAAMKAEEETMVTTGVGGPIADLVIKATLGHPELEHYLGRTIGDIAKAEDKHPIDAMLDIGISGDLQVLYLTQDIGSTDHKKVGELVRNQHVLPGISDGGAHTKFFTGGSFTTDLLTWLVRDTGELTLEQAHYRLSYLPAQASGFIDRGFPAGEWRRVQRAEGYRYIIVNGQVTFQDGECTGATPGELLRLGRWGEARTS
jgi:N-acyl-D-aspartate/D-glutamate deacylase